jgi:hypothetical protein
MRTRDNRTSRLSICPDIQLTSAKIRRFGKQTLQRSGTEGVTGSMYPDIAPPTATGQSGLPCGTKAEVSKGHLTADQRNGKVEEASRFGLLPQTPATQSF